MMNRKKLSVILLIVLLFCVLAPFALAEGEVEVPEPATEQSAPAPAEEVSAPASAEAVAESAPAEEVAEPAPAEKVSEPAPAEEISEPAPAEEVAEPAPAEEVSAPAPVEEVSEPAPAEEVTEPDPAAESVLAEEAPVSDSPIEAESPVQPGIPAPAEPVTVPTDMEPAELKGDPIVVTPVAQFTAADGHTEMLEVGGSVDLKEFVSCLGYEGEIESASSSNPQAFEVVDGQLLIKEKFLDESLTLVINGQEIIIPVHDPDTIEVSDEAGMYNAFKQQEHSSNIEIILKDSFNVNNGKLIVLPGKSVTLDLNKCSIVGREDSKGSVITVQGNFILKSSNDDNNDGSISGGNAEKGGGVKVEAEGTFTMENGSINYNKAVYGGGVYNEGSFYFTGGEINHNSAGASGGGVYQNGEMTVSGSVSVTSNTEGIAEESSNIFLPKGRMVSIGGALKDTSGIQSGILSEEKPYYIDGSPVPVTIVTGTKEEDAEFFSSDDRSCNLIFDSTGNSLQLIPAKGAVARLSDGTGKGKDYMFVQHAINAAHDDYNTVTMLANSEECISITYGKKITLDLNGKELNANNIGSAITNAGTFTLADSSEEKSGTVIGGKAEKGGGVYNEGSFTLTGGTITANMAESNGGGVYNAGSFTMTGGKIELNNAVDDGGGVYNIGNFIMSSGSITRNEVYRSGGGVYQGGVMRVSGNGTVSGNTLVSDTTDNNIYLPKNVTVSVGAAGLSEGAEFGILTGIKPQSSSDTVPVTGSCNCKQTYADYFKSDDLTYLVLFDESTKNLFLKGDAPTKGVAKLHDGSGNGTVYESVQQAVNASGGSLHYITLLDDTVENVTVGSGKDVFLDLNGHGIKANDDGSVISVSGSLTLSDGSEKKTGIITGGNAKERGGGVCVNDGGTFTMNSGKISGNSAENGGGVYVARDFGVGKFIMNGGEISSNTAASFGGGVCTSGEFTMNGGRITDNIGDGVYLSAGSLTLSGSARVMNNWDTASKSTSKNILLGRDSDNPGGYKLITVGTLDGSARFGITLFGEEAPGQAVQISYTAAESDAGCFSADAPDYGVEFNNEGKYLQIRKFDFVAELDDGRRFETVQAAINAADEEFHVVTLLKDCIKNDHTGKDYRENIIIEGKKVTLDLDYYTLQGTGSGPVITVRNNGNKVGDFTLTAHDLDARVEGGAANSGGGVYVGPDARFTLKNGTISGNKAFYGGGVYLGNHVFMFMEGGMIYGNTANSGKDGNGLGGGIYGSNAAVIMNGGKITHNTANSGGGISLVGESLLEMNEGTVSENTANGYGGGVNAGAKVEIRLKSGKISGNKAKDGAGIYAYTDSSVNISGGEISANKASGNGAGIYGYNGSSVNISGGEISNNNASGTGGGLYCDRVIMQSGKITGNTAKNTGGIHARFLDMSGGEISGNTASEDAGGVYIGGLLNMPGEFNMSGGTITGNTATSKRGGGVFIFESAFKMTGGEINENTAVNGGGIYALSAHAGSVLSYGKIAGNKAIQNGGGVFVGDNSNIKIIGLEVSNNSAMASGGGVYVTNSQYSKLEMSSGTITGNTAEGSGGGAYVGGEFYMHGNAEIIGNSAKVNGGGVYLDGNKYSGMKVSEQPRVIGNSLETEKINNVYLPGKQTRSEHYVKKIYIDNLYSGAYIGITTQLKPNDKDPSAFSQNYTGKTGYIPYFNSDDPAYHVEYYKEGWGVTPYEEKAIQVMVLAKGAPKDAVAQLNDPNRTKYPSVQAAVEAANEVYHVVTMLKDSQENVVIDGKTVTLNLNDHELSGKSINASVISLSGGAVFSLNDTGLNGKISGGHAKKGGGVSVTEGSSFTMNSGVITDCVADYGGGGVYVDKDSTFTLNIGNITGNRTGDSGKGGGVFNEGTFNFFGRNNKINENTAGYGGGVYNSSTGKFDMNSTDDEKSDEISGNFAVKQGGGVYNEGIFTFRGGKITKNSVTGLTGVDGDVISEGGGIYQNGEMTVTFSFDSIVTVGGNTEAASGSANNVFLPDGKVVKVTVDGDMITTGSVLGVTTQNYPSFEKQPKIPFAVADDSRIAEMAMSHFGSDAGLKKIREDETLYLAASFIVEEGEGDVYYGDGSDTWGERYAFDPSMSGLIGENDVELVWTSTPPKGVTFTILLNELILQPYKLLDDDTVVFADAGEYQFRVTVKGIPCDNEAPVTFTVLPRKVTVKADDKYKYEGKEDPALTANVTGTLKGDEGLIDYELGRESGEEIGTYAIIPTGKELQGNGNYKVNFVNGTFKIISPEKLIVIGFDYVGEYDGEYHGVAAETNITEGVTVSYSLDEGKNWQQTVPTIRDVREIFVTVKAEKGTEGEKGYQKDEDYYILKVTPKEVTVDWGYDIFPYNGDEQAPTAEVIGVVDGDDVSITVEGSGIDAGDYTATASIDGESAENYMFVNGVQPEHEFTITPLEITLEWSNDEFTYDGKEHAPTAEVIGVLTGETVNVTIEGSEINAGEYTARATGLIGEDCHNYDFASVAELAHDFTIKPKAVTVSADFKAKVAGEADPQLTATKEGLIGTDKLDYTLARESGEDVGVYTILVSGEKLQGNYEVNYESGTFLITNASALTVTGFDYDGVYDAEAHGRAAEANIKDGTIISYSIDGGATWTDAFPTIINAGDIYVIVTAENGNEIATVSYTLTVTPKIVTVTAQDTGKVFGDEDPELAATVIGTLSDDTVQYTLWREEGEAVGTYEIYASDEQPLGNYELRFIPGVFTITPSDELRVVGADYDGEYDGFVHGEAALVSITEGTTISYSTDGGATWAEIIPTVVNVGEIFVTVKAENPNYSTATNTYSLVVTPKAVTVTADDGKKVYGSADPVLTATEEGLIGTDKLVYTLTRESGEAAGSYVITASGDELQGNYSVTFVNGTFTVAPKPVTVRAEDSYKVQGEADPTLKATVEGALEGEEGLIKFTLAREGGEELGTYAIIASGDDEQGNYIVSFVNGTFEIIKSGKLIVIGFDYVGEYDGEYHGVAAETNITEGVTIFYSFDGGATWQTEVPTIKGVNEYSITVKAEKSGIEPDEDTYILKVTPKEVTVTWAGDEFTYNGLWQAPTAEAVGVVPGEAVTVTVEGSGKNTGVYTATASNLSSPNYVFAFGELPEHKFRIYPKEITVTWSDDAFTYDGQEHAPTAEVIGSVEGETVTVTVEGSGKNAGVYTATASNLSSPNYTFASAAETTHEFTIGRKTVTVTADSKIKFVGEKDPDLTVTVEGLIGTDTVNYILLREAGEKLGCYAILVSGDALQGNYIVSFVNGTFKIVEVAEKSGAPETYARYIFEKTAYQFLTGSGSFEAKLIYTGFGAPATKEELKFLVLRVDGLEVSPENYTLALESNGDILIEFTAEYMASLAKGDHALTFELSGCYGKTLLTVE